MTALSPRSASASTQLPELRLDANECPMRPDDLSALQAEVTTDAIGRYPDAGALAAAFARRHGVADDRVVVTAGADDAIDRLARLARGRRVVVTDPTFATIPERVRANGGTVDAVRWDDQGPFPVDAFVAAAEGAAFAFVVSPNNPTGRVLRRDELRAIRDGLVGTSLVLDAAYGEFAADDVADAALAYDDVVVVRTLSKAWGLAGLRVGAAFAPVDLARSLRALAPPYPVATVSLAVAAAALERGEPTMRARVSRVRRERERLATAFRDAGFATTASDGNFVFARATAVTSPAPIIAARLASLGVRVRTFREPSLADALRVTCVGEPDVSRRVERALRAATAPDAILFDLDGVLADVSQSYRRAILETVAAFGGSASPAAIAKAKRRGDANNDWLLTRRLLLDEGIDVALEDVVARFERAYAAYRATETLLVDPAALDRLRARRPLAIVTGRPRRDAERFLERWAIASRFDALVTLEDAPPKPSPEPVRRALEALGVRTAWFVGDTVDDIRAAVSVTAGDDAAVLPMGVVAPGDDAPCTVAALRVAGAAETFADVRAFLEAIP
ncbi:MAG: aminotransferase class I/II-fold pyridoxal phosphate-dependent enzyme [Phycisphaerae bacterium]|nr:aminotransferase class I/II-fold pyridoxal phosphate-dependent enzyme [Phycisphaerae bacterium]